MLQHTHTHRAHTCTCSCCCCCCCCGCSFASLSLSIFLGWLLLFSHTSVGFPFLNKLLLLSMPSRCRCRVECTVQAGSDAPPLPSPRRPLSSLSLHARQLSSTAAHVPHVAREVDRSICPSSCCPACNICYII